jgi:hypothetical protein
MLTAGQYICLSLLTVISDASKLLKLGVVLDGVGTKKTKALKQLGDSTTAASPSITGSSSESNSNENLSIITFGRRQTS